MGDMEKVKIFGHLVPDTDATVAAIALAWYYNTVKKEPAEAYILGELNKETKYVLDRFGVSAPPILSKLEEGDRVAVVDTNNMDELPEGFGSAEIVEIVDHHKLTGGIQTTTPVNVTLRTMASTSSLIYTMANPELHELPKDIAGIMLAAVLSDTLEFRSPTTTEEDKAIAKELAEIAGVDMHELATAMFEAKSDISDISDEELITMDSKIVEVGGKKLRVSVVETTNPDQVIARRESLEKAMVEDIHKGNVDEVLLFAIDILNENATPIGATDTAREIIEKSFGKKEVLEGVVSRKKQIIPSLKV